MADNFIRSYELQEDVIGQLEANATMDEVLDAPQGQDDEQWAYPYGRISFSTNASYDSPYGTFTAEAAFSGIIEESGLTGKFFMDKDGYEVKVIDPDGEEYRLEWAEDDLFGTLDELGGGYEFWNLPTRKDSETFVPYLIFEPEGESPGASLAKYICDAFAEQINYRNAMGR